MGVQIGSFWSDVQDSLGIPGASSGAPPPAPPPSGPNQIPRYVRTNAEFSELAAGTAADLRQKAAVVLASNVANQPGSAEWSAKMNLFAQLQQQAADVEREAKAAKRPAAVAAKGNGALIVGGIAAAIVAWLVLK